METAWLAYPDSDNGAVRANDESRRVMMMQLLVARFPQSVIVSELVAGGLRRGQDGFWRASWRCVLAAATTFSVSA